MAPRRVIVLDTAALLAGLGPAQGAEARWITTPSARAEVRPGGATARAVERAEAAGLETAAPEPQSRAAAAEAAAASGDHVRLSATDLDILGLALTRHRAGDPVELWTDDLAVQNVAGRLGITIRPVVGRGIRAVAQWYVRCTGCGRYPDGGADGGVCAVCGHQLARTRRPPR